MAKIEARFAERCYSIFSATGKIVNDFYSEIGIYFVGAFNALTVAWAIFSELLDSGQPLAYTVGVSTVAFIAVEGLGVYLVTAAAKTKSGFLWFCAVLFASFFTFAHYQEMVGGGFVYKYMALAIPFFVVIGLWARTLKIDVEASQQQAKSLEELAIERQQKLEDDELAHKREMEKVKLDQKQAQKMAQIEAQKAGHLAQKAGHFPEMNPKNEPMDRLNEPRKNKRMNRLNDLIKITSDQPDLGPTEVMNRLNNNGHAVSLSTVKRDLKSLNGKIKIGE
jgi:hypothetical protein